MDKARCAQLKENDLILEVNGEKVYTHSHSDLITLLKRCPKGNTANFLVMRGIFTVCMLVHAFLSILYTYSILTVHVYGTVCTVHVHVCGKLICYGIYSCSLQP